jgi:hypothetical protein
LLVVALLLFGSAIGTIDVVINIQAVLVEKASGRSLMSGFHAFWSIGGFLGAGLVALMLGVSLTPPMVMVVASVLVLGLIGGFRAGLLTDRNPQEEKKTFSLPHPLVLAVAALAFIAFLAEGSILDWSAVYLSSHKSLPMEWAGMGYAVFSVLMLVGRLTGDWIVNRLGQSLVLLLGGLGSAAGVAVVMSGLDIERAFFAVPIVAAAQRCLDLSLDYAAQREQFGKPIAEQQMVQAMLADMYTEIEAARLLAYRALLACNSLEQGGGGTGELHKLCAAALLKAGSVHMLAVDSAVQIHGGMGFMWDTEVNRHYRNAKVSEIGAGTREIRRIIIATELLKETRAGHR